MASSFDKIDGIEVRRYPQRAAAGLAGYLAEYLPSMLATGALLMPDAVPGARSP